jgi:hypothetical protein
MPTTLPRVNVPFERSTYELLQRISKDEQTSLSRVVSQLVHSALELAEDLTLAEVAEERMQTFRRDDALTSSDLITWNKNRRKKQ